MAPELKTLAGRYDLLEVIGRGGMGVVYRGRDRVLHRTVAVKVLPEHHIEDAALVARFAREARAAAALSHPNVVAVFDTGRDSQTHFIVMEHISGQTLAQRLRQDRALPIDDAAVIGRAIALALAAAHRRGIIHRDIKPGNVIISDLGEVKVLDFGIARPPGGETLTRPEGIIGSASYMAPEIIAGKSASVSSDIYALGCVLYEMLTGRAPFAAPGIAGVLAQHQGRTPLPPRQVDRRVPRKLDALVSAMLAKDPHERPSSATEVAQRLSELRRDRSLPPQGAALPGIVPLAVTGRTRTSSRDARTVAYRDPKRHPRWSRRVAAMLALACTLALIGVIAARGHRQPAPARLNLSPSGIAAAGQARLGRSGNQAVEAGTLPGGVLGLLDTAHRSFERAGALIDPALAAQARRAATRIAHATASIGGRRATPAAYDSIAGTIHHDTMNVGAQAAAPGIGPASSHAARGGGGAGAPPGLGNRDGSQTAPGRQRELPGVGPPGGPAGAPAGRVASGGGGRGQGRGPDGAGPPGLDVRVGR